MWSQVKLAKAFDHIIWQSYQFCFCFLEVETEDNNQTAKA